MKGGTMFKQRDIVLIPFPYSDLTGSKQRPALIISNDNLKGDDRICCLITSNQPNGGLFISNNSFEMGDLPFKSWIKPYRLFTIHSKIIKKKLCSLNDDFYQIVLEGITKYIKRLK